MTEKAKPVEPEWGSYPETVCYVQGDEEVMLDLRVPVPSATRDALRALGLAGQFGILTAYNPRGVDLTDEENSLRGAELEAELVSSGFDFVRVDCCSPDRSHCECSVAVVAPKEQLLDMARRWEQIAIFWFDGFGFSIVGAIRSGFLKLPLSGRAV
jgi:hypothetical protein